MVNFFRNKSKLIVLAALILSLGTLAMIFQHFQSRQYLSYVNQQQSDQGAFTLQSEKRTFSATDVPRFLIKPAHAAELPKNTSVKVVSKRLMKEVVVDKKWDGGALAVQFPPSVTITPGAYQVDVQSGSDFLEYTFNWGVLAINTNKAYYEPNEEVFVQMGVLDERGHTVCNARATVSIRLPDQKEVQFSTEDKILQSPTCGSNNVTDSADYQLRYVPPAVGSYTVNLRAIDTGHQAQTMFEVSPTPAHSIERISATRINPFKASYTMKLIVKSKNGFSGDLVETVPKDWKVETDGEVQVPNIVWNMNLQAGESKEFSYIYTAPKVSPQLFLLGPAQLVSSSFTKNVILDEKKSWQIASDATCTSTATGNWNTAGTWTGCGGLVPQTTDDVVIANTHTVTINTSPTVLSVNVNSGGTLTVDGTARTLTLTATTGTLLTNSGTITPGTTLTVTVNPDAATTVSSGAMTLYNLTLSPTITVARTYTLNSGALTINGDFTINPTASSALALTVNMGAAITMASTSTLTITKTSSATSVLDTISGSNYSITTGIINIPGGGNLTARASTITLTGTTGTLFTRTSSTGFTQGTSTLVFNPDASVTLFGGNGITANIINLTPTLTANRTYTSFNANTTVAASTVSINPTASSSLSLTLSLAGALGVTGGNGDLTITGTSQATSTLDTTSSNYALTTKTITIESAGTLIANGSNIELRGTLFTNNGTFTAGTSTVRWTNSATQTITSGSFTFYNVLFDPVINATNRTYTFGTTAVTISNNFTATPTVTSGVLTINLGTATTVSGTTTLNAGSNLNTVSGSNYSFTSDILTIASSATLTAQAATITVSGNYTNNGTFTAGTSTFAFNDATKISTVTGATTFYSLKVTTAGKIILWPTATTQTTTSGGVLTVTGTAASPVQFLSATNGTTWTIDHQGTEAVNYLRVKDSACAATPSTTITVTIGFNAGNNGTCWSFAEASNIINLDGVNISGVNFN